MEKEKTSKLQRHFFIKLYLPVFEIDSKRT
jgi:hypothetical protein